MPDVCFQDTSDVWWADTEDVVWDKCPVPDVIRPPGRIPVPSGGGWGLPFKIEPLVKPQQLEYSGKVYFDFILEVGATIIFIPRFGPARISLPKIMIYNQVPLPAHSTDDFLLRLSDAGKKSTLTGARKLLEDKALLDEDLL